MGIRKQGTSEILVSSLLVSPHLRTIESRLGRNSVFASFRRICISPSSRPTSIKVGDELHPTTGISLTLI